jgi:D-glycero-alpha-D-manno-heptose-7-phosphate kinase
MKDDKVIITKTPLRVSLVGGGTDMPYFYKKYGGETLSFAINRYIYVTAKYHNNYQEKYRLNYSETENTNQLNKIKNLRIKEVIKMLKITKPLYINTFADIPANSGLGSSSSFTVGLIKALGKLKNKEFSKNKLAEMAFKIESSITKNSLGKQDHYIAAYGGFKSIVYKKNKVLVSSINLKKKKMKTIQESILLIWTRQNRLASNVLKDQKKNLIKNCENLKLLNEISKKFKKEIKKNSLDIKKLAQIISKTWELKKKFSRFITNKNIDNIYEKLLKIGSYGGKLLGAGNGGFILAVINASKKKKMINKLKGYKYLDIKIENKGSTIL